MRQPVGQQDLRGVLNPGAKIRDNAASEVQAEAGVAESHPGPAFPFCAQGQAEVGGRLPRAGQTLRGQRATSSRQYEQARRHSQQAPLWLSSIRNPIITEAGCMVWHSRYWSRACGYIPVVQAGRLSAAVSH